MDTRTDFQRLLEDMDKVIQSKRQELSDLDERLESARTQLSEREADELQKEAQKLLQEEDGLQLAKSGDASAQQVEKMLGQQREIYEKQLSQLGEEVSELDSINQQLASENRLLKRELNLVRTSAEKLRAKSLLLVEALEEVKSANLELNLRLAKAESETNLQQKLLKKSSEQDELLLNAFDDKLESMKKAIEDRDEEIKRLRSDNQFALETLGLTTSYSGSNAGSQTDNQISLSSTDLSHISLPGGAEVADGLIDSTWKQRILNIANIIREKDARIELLKSQLLEAAREIENNANLIERLSQFQPETAHGLDPSVFSFEKRLTHEELVSKCEMLESELEHKDKQLHLVEFRNRHFETLLPSAIIDLMNNLTKSELTNSPEIIYKIETLTNKLSELFEIIHSTQRLLDNIEQLGKTINDKDAQIEQLVDDLNQLYARFNGDSSQDETDGPTCQNNLPTRSSQDDAIKEKRGPEYKTLNAIRLTRQPLIDRKPALNRQEQELNYTRATESKEINDGQGNVNELDGYQVVAAQPIRANSASNFDNLSESSAARPFPKAPADQSMWNSSPKPFKSTSGTQPVKEEKSKEKVTIIKRAAMGGGETKGSSNATTTSRKSILRQARQSVSNDRCIDQTVLDLRSRLRQLESENRLLELAMKEILLSIRWSDSKCSTILIDCPSLERLCQLIEARFISSTAIATSTPIHKTVKFTDDRETRIAIGRTSSSFEEMNSPELFQMIVLKSELDLLRGQNEQLRVDIKNQRSEYLRLLSESRELCIRPQSPEIRKVELKRSDVEVQQAEGDQPQQDVAPETVVALEAECQTEQMMERRVDAGCSSCSRLANLTKHLLECIAKTEERVNNSDRIYTNQLVGLYQLTKRLEKELSISENFLSEARRRYHELRGQKSMTEFRLDFMENQMASHLKVCPIYHVTGNISSTRTSTNLQIFATARDKGGDSIQSLTISKNGHHEQIKSNRPMDTRVTINLLRSIIDCLQARLDYKDERLHQLESLLSDKDKLFSVDSEAFTVPKLVTASC